MLKGHGVMNGLACPKESAKPSHVLLEGSGRQTDHSKAQGTVGNGDPSLSDAVVVGLSQSGFFQNKVVTLYIRYCPGALLPAKGSPLYCGQGGSSEGGNEQWMFGVDELGIPQGNCSAMDVEGGVGCMLKGA